MTRRAAVHQVPIADAGAWIAGKWTPPKARRVWLRTVLLFAVALAMSFVIETAVAIWWMSSVAGMAL